MLGETKTTGQGTKTWPDNTRTGATSIRYIVRSGDREDEVVADTVKLMEGGVLVLELEGRVNMFASGTWNAVLRQGG